MPLATNVTNLATRVATESKSLRVLINGNLADLSSLSTTAKSSLVAAINEVRATAGAAAVINDVTPSLTTTYSGTKTNSAISTAVAALVNSAPTVLDTLKELADALGGDASFSTTITTALGLRVRADTAAQGLTVGQQGNARTNILAASDSALTALTTAVGGTETDFVATFNAGLV